MSKHLKFTEADQLENTWLIENDKNEWIGLIVKGTAFKNRYVLKEVKFNAEYTSEYLKEVVTFINSLEKKI